MNIQNLIRDYYILNQMNVGTEGILNDILTHTFLQPPKGPIPLEEQFEELIEQNKVTSLYFGKYTDEIGLEFDLTKHVYLVEKYAKLCDYINITIHWIHIVDNKHIIIPTHTSYAYEEEDMYNQSPTGKCYVTGNSHNSIYVNGHLINKQWIDRVNDYRPWYIHMLENRVQYHLQFDVSLMSEIS